MIDRPAAEVKYQHVEGEGGKEGEDLDMKD
jgi:hypothetical protein